MDFEGSQSTRMVLHNLELLERIFQYLSESKKSLVSASLTTKSFSEPAFNVLWYEMESIWLLFRVLPTFEERNGKYVFTGLIRNEHLQRVLYYAKRIRYLHYKDIVLVPYAKDSRNLMTSTLMRIDKLGAFAPLRKIYLHGPLGNDMLLPLTSPNLDSVEITTKENLSELTEIGVASFLQSFTQFSQIRSLALDGPFRDIILRVLPDFTNLHRLSIYLQDIDIPVHFLKRFATSMPSLRRLHVNIDVSCSPPPPNDMPQGLGQPHSIFRPSFPSLEILIVDCDPTHMENLLGVLDAPLLKLVTLVVRQFAPGVGALVSDFVDMNQNLKDKVHPIFVQPFISMFDIVDTFSYDGPWFHSLTRLSLIQTTPDDGISTAALSVIAYACPNLKALSISIRHPEKPEKPAVKKDGKGCKPHDLKTLVFIDLPDLWDDTISLAIEFVSLLFHLFPAMDIPQYFGRNCDKPDELATHEAWWKGVEDMWRMCQTIRDERNCRGN